MFGHQDEPAAMPVNDNQDNQGNGMPPEPTPDTTLDGSGAMSAPDSAPTPASEPADDNLSGGYIPTDHTGQPAAEPTTVDSGDGDLLNIKQQALQQLSPLVNHLDQTPEEKFHTTMMMIQASDNQSLVKDAYEAANAITDEKTRAQALLDIINEINYFTQHQEDK
jgi:hypothetical protein